jgi:hypothetical protein
MCCTSDMYSRLTVSLFRVGIGAADRASIKAAYAAAGIKLMVSAL